MPDDAHGFARDAHGACDVGRLVVHQHDVGCLDGRIGTHGAHGDTDVGAREDRGVVDAVAYKGELVFVVFAREESFDALHLVAREELRVVLVQAELMRYGGRHLLAVTREHYATAYTHGVKIADGLPGVVFYGVGNYDMTGVGVIDQHMENRPHDFAIGRCEARLGKHLAVTHHDLFAVDGGEDAMSGLVARVRDAFEVELTRVSGADRLRDGVVGEGFRKGCHFEKGGLGVAVFGMDRYDRECAAREGSRLIEHHSVDFGKGLQVV